MLKKITSLCSLLLLLSAASEAEIAQPAVALTLAQANKQGSEHLSTLLVLEEKGTTLKAFDLSEHYNSYPEDPLDIVSSKGYEEILSVVDSSKLKTYQLDELKLSPVIGTQHIAAGTNYRAHQEETNIHSGFLFPKISKPTPFSSQVKTSPDVLLDYEVELCVRFQERVMSKENFDRVVKGFFLCGDMSDRALLLRTIDVDNQASGIGFTDAKSGDDRFPIGPYTVVPKNWQNFIGSVELSTEVNGVQRQKSNASKMIKKTDTLVEDVLRTGANKNWLYGDRSIPLIDNAFIEKGSVILTGTPEGVIFQSITLTKKIMWGAQWALSFSFLDSSAVQYVLEKAIESGFESGRYLQPGDSVKLSGTFLGSINLIVTQ